MHGARHQDARGGQTTAATEGSAHGQAAVVKETGPVDVLKIEAAWPVPKIVDGQVRPPPPQQAFTKT